MFPCADETVKHRLQSCNGTTSGFDYLRLVLALSIVAFHSINVTLGDTSHVWRGAYRAAAACLLPMFFALSGFLVAASLERTKSLAVFLTYRAVRILPALAVEVFLSALVLGPLVTTLPLFSYFSDSRFWIYFGNIIGNIHFYLPGVFEANPRPGVVNQPLWTVPYELECYIALAFLSLTGLVKQRFVLSAVIVAGIILATNGLVQACPPDCLYRPGGRVLVLAFLSGVLSFQYSNRIKLGLPGLVLALWLALVTLSIGQLYAFSILPLTYITVWLGLTTPPKNNLLLRGDYSYGIYLFGYPVQQLAVSWFPDRPYWWFNLFVSLPLIFACAIFSWHIIEKPILARRKIIADFVVNLFSRQSSPL